MAIKRVSGGTSVNVGPGTVKVRNNGSWVLALGAKVRSGGEWKDSLYVAYPNAATNFSASPGTAGSNNTFSWVKPTTGATVTGYKLYVYSDQACTTQVDTKTVSGGDTLSTTYTRGSAGTNGGNGTTYYVRLKTIGAAGESQSWATNSSGGTIIKVVNGSASWPTDNSYWSDTFVTNGGGPYNASSWSGYGYDNSYNPGLAFDGNGSTYWRSQWWSYREPWEWISFTATGHPNYPLTKLVAAGFQPYGNPPDVFYFDLLDGYLNFAQTLGGPGGFYTPSLALIGCDYNLTPNQVVNLRINSTQLGSNPGYSTYNCQMAEVYIFWKVYVPNIITNQATANTITNLS